MKKFLLLFFSGIFGCLNVNAQNDLTLSNMENLFQSTYVNPSSIPVHTLSIGLPGVSSIGLQFTNTGFSYGDLFQRDGSYRNDTLRGNIGNAYSKLSSENYLYAGAETDIFHVRVKSGKMFFSLFSQVKFKARYSYPQNLMDLVVNGNGDKIGEDINFKNLGADVDLYRNIGFGIAKEWKHWVLGANLKYINGIYNLTFDPGRTSGIGFEDKYYAFHSLSDMNLKSSGFREDFSPVRRLDNRDDYKTLVKESLLDFSKNPGGAIDLGATYKPNDKWNYTLSVVNLGYINWKSDVLNRKITGGQDFRGFDVFGYYLRGESKPDSVTIREVKEAFRYTTSTEAYSRWMTPQIYLTAKYNITFKTHLGLMTYLEYYKKLRPAFTFSLYHKFGRVFNIVGTYNIQYQRYDNIGLGLMFKAGPFQLYAAGDNVVAPLVRSALDGFEITKRTIDPIKTFNIRFGLNLVFGKVHTPGKQTYESKKQ